MCKIKIELEVSEKSKAAPPPKKKTVKKTVAERAKGREPAFGKKRKVVIMNNQNIVV